MKVLAELKLVGGAEELSDQAGERLGSWSMPVVSDWQTLKEIQS